MEIRYILIVLLFASSQARSQMKFEKVYYNEPATETPNAHISLENAMSTLEFMKTRVKVINKTDKPLVIKPEECVFKTASRELISKDKWMVVSPNETEAITIDAKGGGYTEAFTFNINGF